MDDHGKHLKKGTLMGAILWTALILGLYYWVHKPVTPPLAGAVGGAFFDIGLAALFVIVAGGLGRRILRRIDLGSGGEKLASEALIGLGALSLLILAVGSIWLHPASMIGLLLMTAAITRRDLTGWARDGRGWLRGGIPASGLERFIAQSVLILVGLALILATLPPTKWDVLTYHLAGPEQWVEHGRLYGAPHNHFLGFPALADTLYAGGMAVGGRLTFGGVLHWMIGGLALILTGSITARYAGRDLAGRDLAGRDLAGRNLAGRDLAGPGRGTGWISAAVLLAAATIWEEMTFAYVDLMLMGLALVGLIALERWDAARANNRYLVLMGAVGGLALSTKYTAFPLGAALGLMALWQSRKDGWRAMLARGAIIGGTAALIFLPWLVRNAIWYDNPVYPFFFESAEMDSIRQDWYSNPGSGLIYHLRTAWQIPLMPLIATIFGVEGAGSYGAEIGPLFLILLPLLRITWKRMAEDQRDALRRVLAVAGIIGIFWIGMAAFGSYINLQTRLVLYLLPLLAIAAAITLDSLRVLPDKPLNLGFVVRAMVGLVVVFTLISTGRFVLGRGVDVYFSGDEGYRDDYLADQLGWHYEAMQPINDLIPDGADTWLLWEPRSLYCDANCRPDSLMDAWYHGRRTIGDGSAATIAERWKADGADYLMVYEFGRDYEEEHQDLYDEADWAAWDQFVAGQVSEVWRGVNDDGDVLYILYQWK